MLFFSIAIKLNNQIAENELSEISQTASFASRRFYEQSENCDCIFVDAATDNGFNCIAMLSNESLKRQTIIETMRAFLCMLSKESEIIDINEITCFVATRKLRTAEKNGFVIDGDTLLNELNIRWVEKNNMIEKLIPSHSNKDVILKRAVVLFDTPSFMDELARIYQQSSAVPYCGHPVHYIIEVDCNDIHLQVTKLMLSALFANKRVRSQRYAINIYASVETINDFHLRDIYESCEGGTCVIDYVSGDRGHEDPGPPDEVDLDMMCRTINKFKHSVLTIICVSPIQKEVREYIMKHFPSLVLIEHAKEELNRQSAASYLMNLAGETNALPDDSLTNGITSDCDDYKISKLQEHFDKWYDDYLKRIAYPQYASFQQKLNSKINKRCTHPPSAYDQLQHMVGLKEAKSFMDQLLNYSKAQTLFKSKGADMGNLPTHMVFTGNPGTAKTTVARLFAQIMKDNNILSIGNLLEVGRADLVGKYVGWTARLVKEKFKEAKGSILFIDEAYSLVDERDGMFGDEAINTIVQEMENHRDNMMVIFAGYPNKMEGFLRRNPGLRSRIGFQIHFPDYTPSELYEIMENLALSNQIRLSPDVKEKLISNFEIARKEKDYGNGRFVRTAYEKARLSQANRLLLQNINIISKEDVLTLVAEDFDMAEGIINEPSLRFIGFGS